MAGPVLFLKRNALLVLLTLALSWLIWVQVSTFFQETWRGEIRVHITAEDEKNTFILDDDPVWVTVEVYGNRRDLERARGNLAAEIRIRPESLGSELQTVRFKADDLEFPAGLDLLSMDPPEIPVTFARRAEATVRVETPEPSGSDRIPGLEFVDVAAWPASIKVEGPEQAVKQVEKTGLKTVPIDLRTYVSTLSTLTELELEIDLDLADWEGSGLEAPIRKVRVRLRFEHVARRDDFWVPLEVHWVDPHPEKNATCFRLVGGGGIVEERDARLKIKISLTGPKSVIDDDKAIGAIRAYVRSDEKVEEFNHAPVRFENVPEGVTVVPIQTGDRPSVTQEKAYELRRDE